MAEPKRYRLLERAEMNGALRDPGYVFTLAVDKDGKEIPGPHRTVVASNHGAQITDHIGGGASALTDVPLYEEVKDNPATPEDESIGEISPELAAAHAEIATLQGQIADKDKQLGEAHGRLKVIADALTAQATDEPVAG